MKTITRLFALTFLMFMVSTAFAQEKARGNKHKTDSAFAKVSERLKLTADQQAKFKEVMKQNRAEMKALRESHKTASEERKKATATQLRKNDERITAILDETQKAEYEKLKAEKKEELKKKRELHKKRKQDSGSIDEMEDELL
jgi:Spy/CpxP family protein refolding chaperone